MTQGRFIRLVRTLALAGDGKVSVLEVEGTGGAFSDNIFLITLHTEKYRFKWTILTFLTVKTILFMVQSLFFLDPLTL